MKNCSEWFIAEQAIFCVSGATVPFYDTLGPETAEYILKQTGTRTVVCTRLELERLCQVKKSGKCPNFANVILADGVTVEAGEMTREAGLQVMSFAKVEAVGAQRIATQGHKHRPPSGDDIFTFCYTSGTTGDPKGALLSHTNLISAVAGVSGVFPIDLSDRHLSYLPLAHIFERIVMCQMYSSGASIAFYRGDPLLLIEDLQACRPTIFPAAPRVLNKIYDKIHAGIAAAGGFKKKLFDAAVATKTHNLVTTGELKHGFYDRLMFNKIKKGLGLDHLRTLVSGSAPLSKPVMIFYRILLGVPIVEGYGQTEGAAASTVSHPDDMMTAGHVGTPNCAAEIVLVDVPEMGYRHTDTDHKGQPCQGRGEIWVRGPLVFKGYYKEPEKTRETVDEDGWLHSGDIGLWTAHGQLQIIDRKKNIFKLSQGGKTI
jgi:long-chain acyl-CoA synthetase